jgi:hypothetical protein
MRPLSFRLLGLREVGSTLWFCIGSFLLIVPILRAETVEFRTMVSWDYPTRDSLQAWRNTSIMIQRTLQLWDGEEVKTQSISNPDATAFLDFWKQPAATARIFYIAAHQAENGSIYLINGETLSASTWTVGTSPMEKRGLVIWDTCHARAAQDSPLFKELGLPVLWAAAADEKTWELNFHRRQPVDLSARFPSEARWLKEHMPPDWNGTLSYFGLAWLGARLQTPHAPVSIQDWQAFGESMAVQRPEFLPLRERSLASRLEFTPAP